MKRWMALLIAATLAGCAMDMRGGTDRGRSGDRDDDRSMYRISGD